MFYFIIICGSGRTWYEEFKRMFYHIPIVQTEHLLVHADQVLHVSFSHNGKYFATCSKDGYVIVSISLVVKVIIFGTQNVLFLEIYNRYINKPLCKHIIYWIQNLLKIFIIFYHVLSI